MGKTRKRERIITAGISNNLKRGWDNRKPRMRSRQILENYLSNECQEEDENVDIRNKTSRTICQFNEEEY